MRKLCAAVILLVFSLPAFSQVTFTIGNSGEPETLDPQLVYTAPEQRISLALFENLASYDPRTGDPQPALAESWSQSADGLTWTVTIREKALWSDGVPITAQTVVDSWLRELDPDTGAPFVFLIADLIRGAQEYNTGKGSVQDVALKALDARTLQFTTVSPAPYVPELLPQTAFSIVPMHVVRAHPKDWTLPSNFVDNGPFVLKEWTPQARVVLQKNQRYWDAKDVKTDSVVFLPMDDAETAYAMYLKGTVDWSTVFPPADRLAEARKRADYVLSPALGTYYYQFNTTKAPFSDVKVRKAFAMAVSRSDVLAKISQAGQVPALSLTPPLGGKFPYTPPAGIPESADKARKLLADAGFPGGKGFPRIRLLYNTNDQHKVIAEALRDRWQQVLGVTVDLVSQEWEAFLKTSRSDNMGGFDMVRAGWAADYRDPFAFLSALGDSGYSNASFDVLVKKANAMAEGPDRMKTFQSAEDVLVDQDVAILPLYFYVSQNMVDLAKWVGWYPNVLDIHPLKDIARK
ncbi:MAG TPA: peptide ABC transporter substrate-binding protein [Spirochaetia bacterium]|nr:peptide ABC transporter substrate-binding protein [Spirochaetia bacterium]